MGLLVNGSWQDQWYDTKASGGRFVRSRTSFRDRVSADGSSGFPAEAGRYHLYVSMACPWAHRALIFRQLKGLDKAISVSGVDALMLGEGWTFSAANPDPLAGRSNVHEVYTDADPRYTGRVTVPVLWDRQRQTIVNNESSELIRMFNTAFAAVAQGDDGRDYYPAPLRPEIDAVNTRIYDTLNNGVYKCGFATSQAAYDEAVGALFDTMDWLEARLSRQRWLVGDGPTEADWRLFPTLLRFDAVYHGHFKCSVKRLVDLPNLWRYARRLRAWPGIESTIDLAHARTHYYGSHTGINPQGIVPTMPAIDWTPDPDDLPDAGH